MIGTLRLQRVIAGLLAQIEVELASDPPGGVLHVVAIKPTQGFVLDTATCPTASNPRAEWWVHRTCWRAKAKSDSLDH